METKEIWEDIKGYEGLYQVSSLGNVKSLNYNHTKKEKVLKPRTIKDGYQQVILYSNGKIKPMLVHRLVVQAFLPNPYKLQEVNHIDENPSNNNAENLEWCEHRYNLNYGSHNERVSKALTNGKKSKPVMCIETGVIYPSTNEVQRQLGFSRGNISQCCNGKKNTSYKYHWKYVD